MRCLAREQRSPITMCGPRAKPNMNLVECAPKLPGRVIASCGNKRSTIHRTPRAISVKESVHAVREAGGRSSLRSMSELTSCSRALGWCVIPLLQCGYAWDLCRLGENERRRVRGAGHWKRFQRQQ